MAIRTPLDDLMTSGTSVGDLAQDVNVPLPGEFPEQTNDRVFKEQQQQAQVRAYKGRELAARGIPSYVDDSGQVQAVRDETGSALTGFIPSKNVAYDSSGKARKMVYGETGAPALTDLFADIPTRTDRKTGVQTKTAPGVGIINVGVDASVAARARLADQDREMAQLSSAVGRKLTLDERDLKLGEKSLKEQESALMSSIPSLADVDSPEAATVAINAHFNDELKRGKASKKTGWFGWGDPTDEAKTAQIEIEGRRKTALSKASELFSLRSELQTKRNAISNSRAQAAEIAHQRVEAQLNELRELGLDVPDTVEELGVNAETLERVLPPAIQRPRDEEGKVIGTTPQANAAEAMAKLEAVPKKALPIDAGEQWNQTRWTDFIPFLGTAREIADLGALGLAASRLQDDNATQEDLALLKDFVERESRDKTFGAKVLSVLTGLPAFAGELAATGGIYSAGAKAGKEAGKLALEKLLAKEGRELLQSKLAQFGVKALGATAGTIAQYVPAAGLRFTEATMRNMLPDTQITADERGQLEGVIANDGDDFATAARKAFGNTFVELLSERTGGALKYLPGVSKLQGIKAAVMKRWFGQNPGATPSAFTSFLNKAGWHGVLGEMFEERVGDVMRGVGAAGEEFAKGNAGGAMTAFVKDALPSLDQLAVEGIAFAIPGAGISAYNTYKGQQFKNQLGEVAQAFQSADARMEQSATDPSTPVSPALSKGHSTAAAFLVGQHKDGAEEAINIINASAPLTQDERADASELMNVGGASVFLAQTIGSDARGSGKFDAETSALDTQLQASGVEQPERRDAIIAHTLGSSLIAKTVNEVAAGNPVTRPGVLDSLTKAGIVALQKGPAGERDYRLTTKALALFPSGMQSRLGSSPTLDAENSALLSAIANGRNSIRRLAMSISPQTEGGTGIDDIFADDPITAGSPEYSHDSESHETVTDLPDQEDLSTAVPALDPVNEQSDPAGNGIANGTDPAWTGGEVPAAVVAAARGNAAVAAKNSGPSERSDRGGEETRDSAGRSSVQSGEQVDDGQQKLELQPPEATGTNVGELPTSAPSQGANAPSEGRLTGNTSSELDRVMKGNQIEAGAAGGSKIEISDNPTSEFKGDKIPTRDAIKAMTAILEEGNKAVPIRVGRYRQRALGIWKDFPEVIRVGTANDLPVIAHEVGHGLQKVVYESVRSSALKTLPSDVKRELAKLGHDLYGTRKPAAGYMSEGFAEFTRIILTTDNVQKLAPKTYEFFTETTLPKFDRVRKAFYAAKEILDQYRAQGKKNKVSADIVDPNSAKTIVAKLKAWLNPSELRRRWVDSFEPLHQLSRFASDRLGKELDIEKDPYLLASALRGVAPARVRFMVDHGMIDYAGNVVGPSLEEAFAPVKDRMDEFMLYLWAEHALERWADGKNPGMSKDEAEFLSKTLGADPKFQIAAQKYWRWNEGLMAYVKEAAPNARPMIDAIQAKWKKYIPLSRWFAPGEVKSVVADIQSGGDASTVTKRITKEGSGREILEPYPVILNNAERWIEMAHKQAVLDAVMQLRDVPGLGFQIEEVPKDMAGQAVKGAQIRDALEKMGVDTSALADDALITFFTPVAFPKGKDPIIVHSAEETNPETKKKELVPRWYHVDSRLFDSLEGVNLYRLPKFLDLVLGVPARLFRLGTTGLRASFSLFTNPSRDLPTLLMQSQSKAGARSLLGSWLRSFVELWNPTRLKAFGGKTPPLVEAFNRLGLEVGQPLGADIQPRKQTQNQSVAGTVFHRAENILDALRSVLSISESAPRIAEMREIAKEVGWDWESGAPMTQKQMVAIMLAAKRVTVDFSAAGDWTRVINQAVPFFNATIQGTRSFLRSWKENPMRTSLRGAAMLTIPALLLWWKNKDEDWYNDLPWREKYLYFNIATDDGRVIQIPRPMEWGNFFATIPEALFDSAYKADPEAVTKAFGHILETTTPDILPVLPRVAKEQLQNQTEFFEAPIVPRSELERPAGDQVGPHTSAVAKWMGGMFPNSVSPRRVDHIIRGLTGGAAGDFSRDFEFLAREMGFLDDRENQDSDIPVLGRAFRRGGTDGATSVSVERFYDAYEQATKRLHSVTQPELPVDQKRRLMLEDGHAAMKVLVKRRILARSLEDEQKINRKIRDIANYYLTAIPEASDPERIPFAVGANRPAMKPTKVDRPQPFKSIVDEEARRRRGARILEGI